MPIARNKHRKVSGPSTCKVASVVVHTGTSAPSETRCRHPTLGILKLVAGPLVLHCAVRVVTFTAICKLPVYRPRFVIASLSMTFNAARPLVAIAKRRMSSQVEHITFGMAEFATRGVVAETTNPTVCARRNRRHRSVTGRTKCVCAVRTTRVTGTASILVVRD